MEHSPRWAAERLGVFYARLLDRAIPRLRRIADRNLSLAYPDKDEAWRKQIIRGVFASVGRLLVAFARLPHINHRNVGDWIRYEGLEHYQRAKERGSGVLFATAHLGNWPMRTRETKPDEPESSKVAPRATTRKRGWWFFVFPAALSFLSIRFLPSQGGRFWNPSPSTTSRLLAFIGEADSTLRLANSPATSPS